MREATILLLVAVLLAGGCRRTSAPEDVALDYGRALYAGDAEAIYRLVSEADRRVKDRASFRAQMGGPRGFARELVRQLAAFASATTVRTEVAGDRATVTLRWKLPDANAEGIRTLARDWDEQTLDALPVSERAAIRDRLDRFRRTGTIPIVEGEETFELVRESGGWRIFLNWAGGVRVVFRTVVDQGLSLRVAVSPATLLLVPGERVRVTLSATNRDGQEVTTRVGHRVEPEADARYLALLQCPLLLPTRLARGEQRDFVSEYVLLGDVPASIKSFEVTYRFRAE